MGDKSNIEWTEATWNPIAAFLRESVTVAGRVFLAGTRGWFCTKVSPGCAHCYAEGINVRLGNGLQYLPVNLDKIEFRLVNLDQPLRWKRPRMIFVNSMTDLFHEAIPDAMIDQVFAVMALAGQHTFQVLTKRAQRMADFSHRLITDQLLSVGLGLFVGEVLKADRRDGMRLHDRAQAFIGRQEPLPNVWLGISAEDQQRFDERVRWLKQTPAAILFISFEPLLGRIDLARSLPPYRACDEAPAFDWAILGGESGKNARPCKVEWIHDLVRQSQAAGVAAFVKQLGSVPVTDNANMFEWPEDARLHAGEPGVGGFAFAYIGLNDRKGGNWNEWPEELRVREMPSRASVKDGRFSNALHPGTAHGRG